MFAGWEDSMEESPYMFDTLKNSRTRKVCEMFVYKHKEYVKN